MDALRILVVGAGGIGGYYAARLADAGHQVVVTGRSEHLVALKARGLTVDYEGRVSKHNLPAYGHAELIHSCQCDDFDLIVISLKSTATESVMVELAPWLKAGSTPVLSIQNGIDNEPLIAKVVGESRVFGGLAIRIGGHIVEPGNVFAEGVAQIVMGAWPQQLPGDSRSRLIKRLEKAFNGASIPTTVTDNIRYELWRKLVINNGVNPLSALTGLDTQSLTHDPKFKKIVYGMMAETVEASKADNINLGQADLEEMFELISNFNAIKTSMLVDKERGRPLELDSISGAVLRRCELLGIEAPYTATVNALLLHTEA